MIGNVSNANEIFTPKVAQPIPASLFFRKGENMGISEMLKGSSDYRHFPFDLFISEKHRLSFKVGDHPLQNGCVVSDHVTRELQEVTIEGLFTNHPMNKSGSASKVTFASEYGESVVKDTVSNTALARFDELKALAKKMEPVRLVTSLEVYPKMIITSIDYDRNEKSGSSIRFTMTLREINIVSLKTAKTDYYFSPESMKDANARLIAAAVKSGKRSADEKAADEMAQLLKVEVAD